MPVIVTFDLPVTDRALFEKHMQVTSTPAQRGSWYWMSDQEAHYRPAAYWQAGTDVSVDLDLNSLPAGNGIYGQESRSIDFQVGDAHVYKVNAQHAPDAGLLQRQRCCAPSRSPPASPASPPAPAPR